MPEANLPSMAGKEDDDIVNWDGILTQEERRRILARLHSALGSIGARIPEVENVRGRKVRLNEVVFDYLDRGKLSDGELAAVDTLAAGLDERVKELETRIEKGDLDESGAVSLMKEVLGLLRALEHLRKLSEPGRISVAKARILSRIDDEKRWLAFLKKVK